MRRCGPPAIVALAAIAALTALTAEAAAKPARPASPTEATAPRDAGEPIMAIVSTKTQQVTFYDADGWILRAPVSTGTTGRETPAGGQRLVRTGLPLPVRLRTRTATANEVGRAGLRDRHPGIHSHRRAAVRAAAALPLRLEPADFRNDHYGGVLSFAT